MIYLKQARQSAKKTIDKMAEVAGVGRGTYMNWEAGRTRPDADNLIKMADYLGCTIDLLCRGDDGECHFLSCFEFITVGECKEICEIFNLLAYKDRTDFDERMDKLRLIAWAIQRERDDATRAITDVGRPTD